jgi:transcription antitermination factor NusG
MPTKNAHRAAQEEAKAKREAKGKTIESTMTTTEEAPTTVDVVMANLDINIKPYKLTGDITAHFSYLTYNGGLKSKTSGNQIAIIEAVPTNPLAWIQNNGGRGSKFPSCMVMVSKRTGKPYILSTDSDNGQKQETGSPMDGASTTGNSGDKKSFRRTWNNIYLSGIEDKNERAEYRKFIQSKLTDAAWNLVRTVAKASGITMPEPNPDPSKFDKFATVKE